MSKRNLQGKALMLLVFSVLVLTAGCTAGANLPETLKTLQYIPDEVLVELEEGVSEEKIQEYDRLFFKVKKYGRVHVIVGLRMDNYRPEGEIRKPEVINAQRARISMLQDRLIETMASYNVTNVKRFKYVPYIVMGVNEAGLLYLISDPDATSIEEDIPESLK